MIFKSYLEYIMDSLIDYIYIFPYGNNQILAREIQRCSLIELSMFIKEVFYSDINNFLSNISTLKITQLKKILIQEIHNRSNQKIKILY